MQTTDKNNQQYECAAFYILNDVSLKELLALPVDKAVTSFSKDLFDTQAKVVNSQVIGFVGTHEQELVFDEPVNLENMNHAEAFNKIQKHMHAAVEKEMAREMPTTHQGHVVKNDIKKTKMIEDAIQGQKLKELADELLVEVQALAKSSREEMSACKRISLNNLITLNVYWKDITNDLAGTQSEHDQKWQSVLRTYFDGKVVFKIQDTQIDYGNHYAAHNQRLVMTPMTSKAYLVLSNQYQMREMITSTGIAGTGKTETFKELACKTGRQVYVMNASDQIGVTQLQQLVKISAWCQWICIDEMNRIDFEILKKYGDFNIALTQAQKANASSVNFENDLIMLNKEKPVFIHATMNPGYAGRTKCPESFKTLAFALPDFALIITVLLYSEGIEDASKLGTMLMNLINAFREKLRKTDHYDFGARQIKRICKTVGLLKRAEPLKDDLTLTSKGLAMVFKPFFREGDEDHFDVLLKEHGFTAEVDSFEGKKYVEAANGSNTEYWQYFGQKVHQLHHALNLHHGVMIIGQESTFKSDIVKTYAKVHDCRLTEIPVKHTEGETMNEYGSYGVVQLDVLAKVLREANTENSDVRKLVVIQQNIDATWMEPLNSLLDDNKFLRLDANNETIKMHPSVSIVFQTINCTVASPATVSRMPPILFYTEEEFKLAYPNGQPAKHTDFK